MYLFYSKCPLRYNMPPGLQQGVQYANFAFTVYFVLEMIIKITGLGPHLYVSDNFNIFDGIVTILGGMKAVSI